MLILAFVSVNIYVLHPLPHVSDVPSKAEARTLSRQLHRSSCSLILHRTRRRLVAIRCNSFHRGWFETASNFGVELLKKSSYGDINEIALEVREKRDDKANMTKHGFSFSIRAYSFFIESPPDTVQFKPILTHWR